MIHKIISAAEFLIEIIVPKFFQDVILELAEDDIRQGNGGYEFSVSDDECEE